MPIKLSSSSLYNLNTCQKPLREFVSSLIKRLDYAADPLLLDISIICGLRGKEDQNKAVAAGSSKLLWPKGKHNNSKLPIIPKNIDNLPEIYKSKAIDIVPYPIDWSNIERFELLSAYGKMCLVDLGLDKTISWGGDWAWKDYPHWELC